MAEAAAAHPSHPPTTTHPHPPTHPQTQEDIPALVAEAAAALPGVECVVAEPIGLDPLMARMVEARVAAAAAAAAAVVGAVGGGQPADAR